MKIDSDVAEVLARSTCVGVHLTLPGQLDRVMYTKVNKVIEAIGGKWDRKAKAHVFPSPVTEALAKALNTGSVRTAQEDGFFQTPKALIERMVAWAIGGVTMDARKHPMVLEPSAGGGAIVEVIAAKYPKAEITAVELNPDRANKLMFRPRGVKAKYRVFPADFLKWEDPERVKGSPVETFDSVVMNPPFSKGQDVDHVLRALSFLRPGGRCAAIMSAGVLFRDDKRYANFRGLLGSAGVVAEKLPEGTFKESGTGVNTVLVLIEKNWSE